LDMKLGLYHPIFLVAITKRFASLLLLIYISCVLYFNPVILDRLLLMSTK